MIFIEKSELYNLLSKDLSQKYGIIAPQRINDRVEYLPLDKDPAIDIFPPTNSIKQFFFPRSEVVVTFKRKGKRLESVAAKDEKELLLFGVRPCDATSLNLLDAVFTQEYKDSQYLERRKASTIICIACNHPRPDCFCASVGGSPFGKSECDVLAVEIDDGFLFEATSESGSSLIETLGGREATEDEIKKSEKLKRKAKSELKNQFDLELVRKEMGQSFENDFWDDFSAPCISCSVCTFICPTCHCFDITDVKTKVGADRIKTWDSCMSQLFTLHASGHNPRREKYRRWRQRIFHKFEYLPVNLDILGCVGCGRCITHCPVGMDIRRMLQIVCGMDAQPMEVTKGG